MGIKEVYVLDTCAGLGKIWTAMEEKVTIRQWTRCDLKPRRAGVLRLDATEALEKFDLSLYNVIDIDPYGEPWEPFLAMLPRLTKPTAVFLTHCQLGIGSISLAAAQAVGIPQHWHRDLPHDPNVAEYVAAQILGRIWKHAEILHAAKVSIIKNGGSDVHYYALGLKPTKPS
jgi:hypothetical protein